jgi:hypothetical protein
MCVSRCHLPWFVYYLTVWVSVRVINTIVAIYILNTTYILYLIAKYYQCCNRMDCYPCGRSHERFVIPDVLP